ncbi:MAG TPA: hypothetical protein VHE80_09150 [Acidimicrobiales bacterium]|nr:hypothetical protein [Acidimicrobiales bacterium]
MNVRATPSPLTAPGWAGVILFVGFGTVVLVLRLADQAPVRQRELVGAVAMGCLYAAPGLLALLARAGRPLLLLSGAVLGFALVPTSFSITPLLVLPSALLLVARRRTAPDRGRTPRGVAVVVSTVAFAVPAFVVLFASDDPLCWTYSEDASGGRHYVTRSGGDPDHLSAQVGPGESGGGCTSDVITPVEGLASLTFTGLLLVSAVWLARPVGEPERRPVRP